MNPFLKTKNTSLTMRIQQLSALLMLISLFLFTSCGRDKAPEGQENDAFISVETEDADGKASVKIGKDNIGDAINEAVNDALGNDGEAKEVVAYQKLKDLMPNKVLGMSRSNLEGQKTGMSGMNFSTASATYEEGNQEVTVNIMDAGGSALVLSGLAMWANMEFERESDDGYERTTKIDGHKAFEQYDKNSKSGQVSVLVDNRFVVNIEGNNVGEKDLRKVLDDINLRRLSNLQ